MKPEEKKKSKSRSKRREANGSPSRSRSPEPERRRETSGSPSRSRSPEPEGGGLERLIEKLKSANSHEAEGLVESISAQLRESNSEEHSPETLANLIKELVNVNLPGTVQLAEQIVRSDGGIKVIWDVEDLPLLREILDSLKNVPDLNNDRRNENEKHGVSNAEVVELAQSYQGLAQALVLRTGAKEMAGEFWDKLFKSPNTYHAVMVNAFDQMDFIEKSSQNARFEFLHNLSGFLAKSKMDMFQEAVCIESLNNALSDALELCFDDVKDGESMGEEASRVVRSCLSQDMFVTEGVMSVHGNCLKLTLENVEASENKALKRAFYKENFHHLLELAMRDMPSACTGSFQCSCEIGEFAKLARSLICDDMASEIPELLAARVDQLIRIYKAHPDPQLLRGVTNVYPKGKKAIEAEFPYLFQRLIDVPENVYPKDLYDIIIKFSAHAADLFEAGNIGQLVNRIGICQQDTGYVLEILENIAINNTPVMVGRGQNYYMLVMEGGNVDENVKKMNEIMTWMALFNNEEAERVVGLMEEAHKEKKRLQEAHHINHMLKCWQEIAKVHPKPFEDREETLKHLLSDPETQNEAEKLIIAKNKGGGGGGCCNIL